MTALASPTELALVAAVLIGFAAWFRLTVLRPDLRRNRELRRSAIGDEALRAIEAERVRRSRERTGNVAGKAYEAAKRAALKALRERHADEYAHLFELAKRGEL